MLSSEIRELENENYNLKKALQELADKMEGNAILKPKSCQYCKNYIQHYAKGLFGSSTEFSPVYAGHCVSGVPVKKGGKKSPTPDDTCPYFEFGIKEMRYKR